MLTVHFSISMWRPNLECIPHAIMRKRGTFLNSYYQCIKFIFSPKLSHVTKLSYVIFWYWCIFCCTYIATSSSHTATASTLYGLGWTANAEGALYIWSSVVEIHTLKEIDNWCDVIVLHKLQAIHWFCLCYGRWAISAKWFYTYIRQIFKRKNIPISVYAKNLIFNKACSNICISTSQGTWSSNFFMSSVSIFTSFFIKAHRKH